MAIPGMSVYVLSSVVLLIVQRRSLAGPTLFYERQSTAIPTYVIDYGLDCPQKIFLK